MMNYESISDSLLFETSSRPYIMQVIWLIAIFQFIPNDPGGYQWPPTSSNISKLLYLLGVVSIAFGTQTYKGHFKALNDVFFVIWGARVFDGISYPLDISFQTSYLALEIDVVCKSYTPEKLMYQSTTSRPINILVLHLLRLCFWSSKFLSLC